MISASSLLLSHFSALTVSSQKRLFDVRKTEILEGAGCGYTRERLAGLDLLKGNLYGLQELLVNAGSLLDRIFAGGIPSFSLFMHHADTVQSLDL